MSRVSPLAVMAAIFAAVLLYPPSPFEGGGTCVLPSIDACAHFFDLRVYSGSVRHWLAGGELYDYVYAGRFGFTYPPFAGLLMACLTHVPVPIAAAMWVAGTTIAGFLLVSVITRGWLQAQLGPWPSSS